MCGTWSGLTQAGQWPLHQPILISNLQLDLVCHEGQDQNFTGNVADFLLTTTELSIKDMIQWTSAQTRQA